MSEPRALERSEFIALARRLESFHELFSALWEIGEPILTRDIDTAAIVFDPMGAPLKFLFNPDFWQKLPEYDRDFVVCHEMLHAVLNHGFRGLTMRDHRLANVAADIVVNHLLTSKFGFMRELLQDWRSICWVDTVFAAGKSLPATNLTMEQYYELLMKLPGVKLANLVDQHCFDKGPAGSLVSPRAAAEMDARLADLGRAVTKELAAMLGDDAAAKALRGDKPMGAWCSVEPVKPKPVRWEQVLRARLARDIDDDLSEGWVIPARRFCGVEGLEPPGNSEGRLSKPNRLRRCVLFLDTSGSVWQYRDRFFGLARSLPARRYGVVLCSFDTEVYVLDLKKLKVAGGGGTCFAALESWLQAREAGRIRGLTPPKQPYPDAVIVITDGYGGPITPKHPERWHWLLTTDCADYLPQESVKYRLQDYS